MCWWWLILKGYLRVKIVLYVPDLINTVLLKEGIFATCYSGIHICFTWCDGDFLLLFVKLLLQDVALGFLGC